MILQPDQIKQRLKNLRVGADKYLGQHFLIDQTVLDTIRAKVRELKRDDQDMVVEVGPGLGVLTEVLVQEMDHVIAIEKDPIFAQALASYINQPHLTTIQGDALQVLENNPGFPVRFNRDHLGIIHQLDPKLSQIDDSICFDNPGADMDWLFVANIPYAITSPLLHKLVELETPPRHIIVLMQKEVAERLMAQPGDSARGLLTIQIEVAAQTKIIMPVPPSSFWPEPKVDSVLVHIEMRAGLGLWDEEREHFFKIVAAGFSQKRKQIHNSLSATLGIPSNDMKAILQNANIDPNRRAETLTLSEWHTLSKALQSGV